MFKYSCPKKYAQPHPRCSCPCIYRTLSDHQLQWYWFDSKISPIRVSLHCVRHSTVLCKIFLSEHLFFKVKNSTLCPTFLVLLLSESFVLSSEPVCRKGKFCYLNHLMLQGYQLKNLRKLHGYKLTYIFILKCTHFF